MNESIDNFIGLISENGGFTVVGWYKRGIISDQILLAARRILNNNNAIGINRNSNNNEELQVDTGDISYHFVHIVPTNHNFLDYSTSLGQHLNGLKYNVTEIDAMHNNQR
eukprot:1789437-Ditylum_brightwellii.AAC.1